ncbi:MAG: tripartite tricarboxylate transporter substrate binding protein [Burkholderiales bacterium]|nr:tripartite tricarboxylate transporter substrate binding protein [Burkholderiales bacterium]ODU63034.1 MAG: hypothetical protein ABT05_06320 [Lautropia sp. SCN 66-9]
MHRIATRILTCAALIAAPLATHAASACDQATVRFVVPFPASGSSADLLGRSLASALSKIWNKSVVVDNRSGGGQVIGTQAIAGAKGDGCTLGLITSALSLNPSLMKGKLPYDSVKDIRPAIRLVDLPLGIFTLSSSPIKTMADLQKAAASRELTYGTPGVGSMPHLAGALMSTRLPANLRHVPYRGLPAAKVDLLAGQIDMIIGAVSTEVASVKAGDLRLVAVLSEKRFPEFPNVPTVAEQHQNLTVTDYFGVAVPAAMTPQALSSLYQDVTEAMRSPEVTSRLAAMKLDIAKDEPGALAARVVSDMGWMSDLVAKTGMSVE